MIRDETDAGLIRFLAGSARPAEQVDADVIILTLHRAADSCDAIRSALAQTGVARHVWVLDQGSTELELAQLIACVAGRPDVSLFRAARNLGVGGGRNALSMMGRARVIAAIDNDATFADETTLARMVEVLDTEQDLAALGCRIVSDATGDDDLSSWGYPMDLLGRSAERFDTVTFVGAGHAIRRRAWRQAGPYDASLFFCWEEYDFCLRAIAQGWRIAYHGDLVVRHRVAAEQRQAWSDRRWYHFVRNRLQIERKTGSNWPSLVPRIGAYAVMGALNGLTGPTLRAIAAAASTGVTQTIDLPREARAYLAEHDTAHRGSLWHRWRREVLGRLPDQPNLSPANLSRASSAMTAGLSNR